MMTLVRFLIVLVTTIGLLLLCATLDRTGMATKPPDASMHGLLNSMWVLLGVTLTVTWRTMLNWPSWESLKASRNRVANSVLFSAIFAGLWLDLSIQVVTGSTILGSAAGIIGVLAGLIMANLLWKRARNTPPEA